jgi:hypothetical protein
MYPIPKLLPGLKTRAFFSANYEQFTESDGSEPVFDSVPSAAERTGDFSELLGGPSSLQLYNPYFTTYDANGFSSRPAIPNNRLDLAPRPNGSPLVDPASAPLLAIYPLPNILGTPSYLPNYQTTQRLGFTNYHLQCLQPYSMGMVHGMARRRFILTLPSQIMAMFHAGG